MTTPWQPGFQGTTVVPPGYNDPHNYSPVSALQQVLSSGTAGFTLQNATPTILGPWTAPADNQSHVVMVLGEVAVSSAETGGAIRVQFTPPNGSQIVATIDAGAHGSATVNPYSGGLLVVAPGTTVTIVQGTALTVGAAVAYTSVWAA